MSHEEQTPDTQPGNPPLRHVRPVAPGLGGNGLSGHERSPLLQHLFSRLAGPPKVARDQAPARRAHTPRPAGVINVHEMRLMLGDAVTRHEDWICHPTRQEREAVRSELETLAFLAQRALALLFPRVNFRFVPTVVFYVRAEMALSLFREFLGAEDYRPAMRMADKLLANLEQLTRIVGGSHE